MGSVQSNGMCPQCKYEYAVFDYYYRRDAEYIFCERCGYSLNRDQEGIKESFGVGSYKIMPINGFGVLGSFESKEGVESFLKDFKEGKIVDNEGNPPRVLTYTFQREGEWFVKDLINDKVEPFPNDLFKEDDD